MRNSVHGFIICFVCGVVLFFTGCAVGPSQKTVTLKPDIPIEARKCIECHQQKQISQIALRDWQFSAHAEKNVTCVNCHIPLDNASKDIIDDVTLCEDKTVRRSVSPKNCELCHQDQVKQFADGKHARAWKVLENLQGTKKMAESFKINVDCDGCHRIGKEEGKCDSCHTRHRFSAAEARRPEACRTCHMGDDHPQWETYSTSKHGSIYSIEGNDWYWEKRISEWYKGPLLESSVIPRAPVCVTCHMPDGNHGVNTAWGFLGMRLSEKDPEWRGNRDIFFKGLFFFDEDGNIAEELKAIVKGQEDELTKESWVNERGKMVKICSQCHTSSFSKDVLGKSDAIIKECDKLMANAINIVDGLYKDGIIKKSERFFPHVDILRFDEFGNPIEERLYKMFADHRMKTYLGAFHINPAYQHGYGWTEMMADLRDIETMANNLRKQGSEK